MKIQIVIALLFLTPSLCAPRLALGQQIGIPVNITEEMLFTDDPKDWMKPRLVSVPVYPKRLLEQGIKGQVDVRVAIDEYGKVLSASAIKSTPPQPEFERSAVESIQYWTMNSVVTDQCVPILAEGTIRIWYDIKDGKPSVSISTEYGTYANVNPQAIKAKLINEAELRADTQYPAIARKEGLNALVHAVAIVDAATGLPARISIPFVKTSKYSARAAFANSVEKALALARFEPRPEYSKKYYAVCMPFVFLVP